MKAKKTNLKSAAILAGVLVTGTANSFAATNNSSELLNYANLGSGAEVRTELIKLNVTNRGHEALESETTYKLIELTCGEGKCGEGDTSKDKKSEDKSDTKEGDKTSEDKTDESKCGEGKCGEKK